MKNLFKITYRCGGSKSKTSIKRNIIRHLFGNLYEYAPLNECNYNYEEDNTYLLMINLSKEEIEKIAKDKIDIKDKFEVEVFCKEKMRENLSTKAKSIIERHNRIKNNDELFLESS